MRDVKTRAAMEQPKTRQKNAMPRKAVRILQRHYAQQKQGRQTQHQRQPVEYATEQVQQGASNAARLTFRATRQLQRKYVEAPTTTIFLPKCSLIYSFTSSIDIVSSSTVCTWISV